MGYVTISMPYFITFKLLYFLICKLGIEEATFQVIKNAWDNIHKDLSHSHPTVPFYFFDFYFPSKDTCHMTMYT